MKRFARIWVYRLRRLAALDRRSLGLLFEAQWLLLWAWWQVKRRPVGGLVEVVSAGPAPGRVDGASATPDALVVAMARASRHGIFQPSCLVRALALCRLLDSHGHHGGVVRVGVRKEDAGFAAHAWVELNGLPIGEDPSRVERYVRLTAARLASVR